MLTEKSCSKCGIVKPVSEFYVREDRAIGYFSNCKACMDVAQKAKRAARKAARPPKPELTERKCRKCLRTLPIESFPIRGQARKRRYFICTECKESMHPEPHDAEYYRQQNIEWKRNNPGKVQAYVQNRRARLREDGGTVTEKEWEALKLYFNRRCLMCHKREPEIELTRDHVTPVTAPFYGRHAVSNLQPLCKSCNSKKGDTVLDLRHFLVPLPEILKQALHNTYRA